MAHTEVISGGGGGGNENNNDIIVSVLTHPLEDSQLVSQENGGSKSEPQESLHLALHEATVMSSQDDIDTSEGTANSIHEPTPTNNKGDSSTLMDQQQQSTPPEFLTPPKRKTTNLSTQPPTTPQEYIQTFHHNSSSHSHAGSRNSSLMEYFLEAPSPANSEASTVRYPEIARKLFNEEFVSIQPEEYTQFIAANDEESSIIRMHYMDLFKWNSNLLKSTRTLCSKLYLKGESQEIDRILSSFTKSYLKQHPKNVFQTQDFEKIYIVIYSLILLNTTLHNSEVTKKSKISQADYIRNTFSTFLQQNSKSSKPLDLKQRIMIEGELSKYYESLAKNELHLKRESKRNKQFRNSMISSHSSSHEYRSSNGAGSSSGTTSTSTTKNKPHPPLPASPTTRMTPGSTRKAHNQQQQLQLQMLDTPDGTHQHVIPGTFPDPPKESWNASPNNDSSETIGNTNSHEIEKVSLNGNGGSDSTTVPEELDDQLEQQYQDDGPLHSSNAIPPNLISRQMSASSAWSSESGPRRPSLQMNRCASNQSQVSHMTSVSHKPRNKRVGFTRALISDQNSLYRNGNGSRVSTAASSIRTARACLVDNRSQQNNININEIILNSGNGHHRRRSSQSSNHGTHGNSQPNGVVSTATHSVQGVLNKRVSRASIVSNESLVSYNDDTLSMISLDTADINLGNQFEPEQNIEEFNVDDYQDYYDLTLELQGAPYLKEGLMKLKVINNDHDDNSSLGDGLSSSVELTNGSVSSSASSGRFFSFFKKSGAKSGEINASSENLGLLPTKFTEQFVVVSKGQLSLYSFDPKIIKKYQKNLKKIKKKVQSNHQSRLGGRKLLDNFILDEDVNMADEENIADNSTGAVGDGNWLKNAANIGVYNLCSTFSQVEKLENTQGADSNMVLWSLTFPKVSKRKPKKFLFEAGTREIALEFVNTCNFWASKITAIPTLEESVSSIEYGWNDLDRLIQTREQFKRIKTIEKWEPTIKGVYLSNYVVSGQSPDIKGDHFGMMKQFVKTLRYYNHLKKLYHDFAILRERFNDNFPIKKYSCSNYTKIINNYNAKIVEYRNELKKYKHYLIILGFGLQLRFDLEEEDRLQELDQTLNSEGYEGSDNKSVAKAANNNSPTLVAEDEDDLTKLVKKEIHQLFSSLKDLDKKIPSYESSKSLQNIVELTKLKVPPPENLDIQPTNEDDVPFHLVKSPKTFAFSEFQDIESPVSQLLKSGGASPVEPASAGGGDAGTAGIAGGDSNTPAKTITHSFSTNTIQEEEEPEDDEMNNTTMMNTTSQSNASKGIASTVVVVKAHEAFGDSATNLEVVASPETKIEKVSEIVKAKVSPTVHIVNVGTSAPVSSN